MRDLRARIITPWKETVISYSASPVLDSEGRVIGATTVQRDVSDRVELERQKEELYRREHVVAEALQEALIPSQIPRMIEGWSVAARYVPALEEALVGGDFYDLFELGNGKLGVLIGDIAGKGLSAAIRVAAVRYSIRSYAYLNSSPAAIMRLTNDAICREQMDERNVLTAFFGIMDIREGTITYADAGHEPPVVRNARGEVNELQVTGPMLGVSPDMEFSEQTIRLEPGDDIVMFTDGITEARVGLAMFAKEGVIEHLGSIGDVSPDEIAEGLLKAAMDHAKGVLHDDAAIVVLGYEGKASD